MCHLNSQQDVSSQPSLEVMCLFLGLHNNLSSRTNVMQGQMTEQ